MKLLLDTHIVLWALAGSTQLRASTRRFIVSADEVYVSAASVWEIVIPSRLGKIGVRIARVIRVGRAVFTSYRPPRRGRTRRPVRRRSCVDVTGSVR